MRGMQIKMNGVMLEETQEKEENDTDDDQLEFNKGLN